jgi:hypothetical protein
MIKSAHSSKALHPIRLYGRLMEEAKIRLSAIHAACAGTSGLLAPFVGEFCYLQLRMLCELIALACLVAHGDVPGTDARKVRKAWAAGLIIDVLDKLHPPFYPMPVVEAVVQPGKREYRALPASEYLTKEDLKTLSSRCSNFLHRGDVMKVRDQGLRFKPMIDESDLLEIVSWTNKIMSLLGGHLIALHDEKTIYICFLRTDESEDVFIGAASVLGSIWPHVVKKS